MFDLKKGVNFMTSNGLQGLVTEEIGRGEHVLAKLYVEGQENREVVYNQRGVPQGEYSKKMQEGLTIQNLLVTESYMGVDLGGEDQTLIAIQYNGKTYPINVGDVTTPQQVSDIVNNLLNQIDDDAIQLSIEPDEEEDNPSKPHKRPMNMTPNQQETVQDKDNSIDGMLSVSGTNIVLGHSLDDDDTIIMHHEDSAEPTYMSRREALILGHMLVSIAES